MLEAAQHGDNAFVTLTYADDKVPADNSVHPRVLQLFVKRLRKSVPYKFRYFACGEYGEFTGRPHYHLALFGFPSCDYAISRKKETCCTQCELVRQAWSFGNVFLGQLEPASAAYVAGYVAKKYTAPQSVGERWPPFARMSLRPGIGVGMMDELASTLMEHSLDKRMIDVPLSLQHGSKRYPLGRYLRRRLRTLIGRPADCPQEVIDAQKEELSELRKKAFEASTPFKEEVLKASLGRRIQIESRHMRYRKDKV